MSQLKTLSIGQDVVRVRECGGVFLPTDFSLHVGCVVMFHASQAGTSRVRIVSATSSEDSVPALRVGIAHSCQHVWPNLEHCLAELHAIM